MWFVAGLLDRVKKALTGFEVVEFSGIEPNPRVTSVNAAAKLAREQKADFIVAVGGGSVIDASKAIAAAVKYDGDAWDLVKDGSLIKDALPLFSVLTLAATGSEYDAPGVISNMDTNESRRYLLRCFFRRLLSAIRLSAQAFRHGTPLRVPPTSCRTRLSSIW